MNSQEVMNLLKARGYKFTPQRRAVVEALALAPRPLTAKDLVENLRDSFPDMSPDTVYRTLKVLASLGIVSAINQQGKEGARFELDGQPHHHHLVCIACGLSVCLPYCPMGEKEAALASQEEFQVVGHNFEIFGLCRDCQTSHRRDS